ncbi:hypothetical protein K1T71_004829 [Dendrolimus kikuchii]|uniref:Uncharacterized protein n=1 Tax=Dendrolimus kikuchii TaxID=765133 RepID=A0ACC1D5J3_9NEOP|nr:hypothetical protein K1T71_004829 [Dendrolimus kikuchii]
MEHVRQHDWYATERDDNFLNENELDNCVMERIIRNKFYDPLLSESDTEQEGGDAKINWEPMFKKIRNDLHNSQSKSQHATDSPDSTVNQFKKYKRNYVPCLKSMPPYPRVSNLTIQQHNQLLKVICSQNSHVLPYEFVLRPTKTDHKLFEQLQSIYKTEQQEYIEWAKSLWTSTNCIRALRPKPSLETIYKAEYKMKANEMSSFPKSYQLAAQIPYGVKDHSCELTHKQDLITVNASDLPQIEYPDLSDKFHIMKPCSVPKPCTKHPCRFVLPNEKSVTMLPLTEIHRELAQYASEHGAQYIVSEKALCCIVEEDKKWTLPLSVCQVIDPDGEKRNVVVMGNDFTTQREISQVRSYKAFRHLLEFVLIPPSERTKSIPTLDTLSLNRKSEQEMVELSTDEEDDSLFIDADDLGIKNELLVDEVSDDETSLEVNEKGVEKDREKSTPDANNKIGDDLNDLGIFTCTCEGTENPPPRSFRVWKVSNKTTNESFNVIVHCSHRTKTKFGEVVLEPIPEYQLDLGGVEMSPHRVRSLALSLALRKNTSLLTARVEAATGEMARYDIATRDEWKELYGDPMKDISATIYTSLSQLQGLLPGNYLLRHEPSHGMNAMLYVARPNGTDILLEFKNEPLDLDDEAKGVKTPPKIEPVLLPYHKSRRILPCAFTPYEAQVAKEHRKPLARRRAPSPAIKLDAEDNGGGRRKWPKKKKKKSKKN